MTAPSAAARNSPRTQPHKIDEPCSAFTHPMPNSPSPPPSKKAPRFAPHSVAPDTPADIHQRADRDAYGEQEPVVEHPTACATRFRASAGRNGGASRQRRNRDPS